MDYQGIAILLGAVAALITVVGGLIMQIAVFIRQGSAAVKMAEMHVLVNGQSEKLNAALQEKSYRAGERAGQTEERANPMIPKPAPALE